MNDVVVIIPVYFADEEHVNMTYDLLNDLRLDEEISTIFIQFNGGTLTWISKGGGMLLNQMMKDTRVEVINAVDRKFYAMWNDGCRRAVERHGDNVLIALLNNDLRLEPGTITRLAGPLRDQHEIGITYPDYDAVENLHGQGLRFTRGTFRNGGMSGFAFMFRGDLWQQVGGFDEEYVLWYGDDDFERRVRERYDRKIARVLGLPIEHLHSRTVAHRHDLLSQTEADRQRFVAKFRH